VILTSQCESRIELGSIRKLRNFLFSGNIESDQAKLLDIIVNFIKMKGFSDKRKKNMTKSKHANFIIYIFFRVEIKRKKIKIL